MKFLVLHFLAVLAMVTASPVSNINTIRRYTPKYNPIKAINSLSTEKQSELVEEDGPGSRSLSIVEVDEPYVTIPDTSTETSVVTSAPSTEFAFTSTSSPLPPRLYEIIPLVAYTSSTSSYKSSSSGFTDSVESSSVSPTSSVPKTATATDGTKPKSKTAPSPVIAKPTYKPFPILFTENGRYLPLPVPYYHANRRIKSPNHLENSNQKSTPGKLNFEYIVKDHKKNVDFGHWEKQEGADTKGRYNVVLPDGRRQIVDYRANDAFGYIADITYEEVPLSNFFDGEKFQLSDRV